MSKERNTPNPNQLSQTNKQKCYLLSDSNIQQYNGPYSKHENKIRRVFPNLNLNLSHNETTAQSSKVIRNKKKGVFNLPSKENNLVPNNSELNYTQDIQRHLDSNNQTDIEMSLLEIFDSRFKLEESSLPSIMGGTSATTETVKSSVFGNRPMHDVASDEALEEIVRASEIPDNLQDYLLSHPESDPVRAISCLSQAERREKILQKISKSLGCDR